MTKNAVFQIRLSKDALAAYKALAADRGLDLASLIRSQLDALISPSR